MSKAVIGMHSLLGMNVSSSKSNYLFWIFIIQKYFKNLNDYLNEIYSKFYVININKVF